MTAGMERHAPLSSDCFSFSRFARHRVFTEINRWLVEHVDPLGPRVVDLACGPGAITELILSTVVERSGGLVYAVDPSHSELDHARRRITSGLVRFVHGSAEHLSRFVPRVDAVLFGNAIHLVADKRRVLDEIRTVLRPGGTLGFNTTFFKGCYVPGTERFSRYWILRAAQYLRKWGVSVRRPGTVQVMQWFSPEEYEALVAASGFVDSSWQLQEVQLPPESLEDIAQFSMFIEGALPGVPLELGAEALRRTARVAMHDANLGDAVPRYWLQFLARVPAPGPA